MEGQVTKVEVPGKVVTLPGGVLREGKIHRDAEIVSMTGLTRKSIARDDVRTNPTKVCDIILLQCLKRVGPFPVNGKLLNEMLIGDRDFLLLEIRRASMGETLKVATQCADCKNPIEVAFQIDEFEITRVNDSEFEVREDQRVFTIKKPGLNVLCRYPSGEDQQGMSSVLTKNPVEASYRLYAACVLEWNGQKGPFTSTFFEALPVGILDEFQQEFMGPKMPGPDLRKEEPCPVCANRIPFTFGASDFFFPHLTRGKK